MAWKNVGDGWASKMRLQLFRGLMNEEPDDHLGGEARWKDLAAGSQVVWASDGQPVRHIAPRSRLPVGRYNSRKAGRMLHHQSRGNGRVGGEKLALMICEIDPAVVDFRSQHVRFDVVIAGSMRAYFPDIVALRHDGTIAVIEVKHDGRWQFDVDYRRKLDAVQAVCDGLGWTFEIWTQSSMAPSPTVRDNIAQFQMQRFVEIDPVQALIIEQEFQRHEGRLTIAQIKHALGNLPGAGDIARGMMCRGALMLPLDRVLCDATVATKFARCASPNLEHAA